MQDITKAQITIGLLAFFATVWSYVKYALNNKNLELVLTSIGINFVIMIVLSFVLISILQWLRMFDLKTNSILTLFTLVTIHTLSLTI